MAMRQDIQIAAHRIALSSFGGGAAIALWALVDNWDNPLFSPAIYLALFSFLSVYLAVALALTGPVPMPRALAGAVIIAAPMTALVSLAAQRNVVAINILDDPVMLTVAGILVLFTTPFLLVWLQDRSRWAQYDALFEAAWAIVVRYAVAWFFVAVFWTVAFLSNALLKLVDITVIDQLLGIEWMRFGLTGAVLGLGLAVVHELRDTVSHDLVLRLLRLLVPVVLAVVAAFLTAVPLRGLSQLFGDFSAASTLMGAAIASVLLISTAVDKDDTAAVSTAGLRLATRILAVLLPFLAGLSVWAVLERVTQYGWTPDRVLAFSVAAFLLLYGLSYGAVSIVRKGWMRRIRRVNVVMAWAVIVGAALWMTPVLNAYQIATSSQVARFQSGQSTLAELALWQMAHDWGKPGRRGLEQLETMTDRADHAELVARIETVRDQINPFQFEQAIARRTAPDRAGALASLLAVRPTGAALPIAALAELPSFRLDQWLAGCRRTLPDGRPGCVLVKGPFVPATGSDAQGIVLYLDADGLVKANHVQLESDGRISVREVFDPVADQWPTMQPKVIEDALDGDFVIRPSGDHALFLDGAVLVPGN